VAKFLGRIIKPAFQLFVFLLPVQLGYHFWPKWAYIFGIRSDYLSPTIYLTDLVFIVLLLLILLQKKRELDGLKILKWALAIIALAGLNLAVSVNAFASLFKWVKVVEISLLVFLTASLKSFEMKDWVAKPLVLSTLAFSAIGIFQVIVQRTLGGPLYYLGERAFSVLTPGIALTTFFGRLALRAYSTFPHPNAFAGFLGISIIFMALSNFNSRIWKRLKVFTLLIAFAALILSGSVGGGISLLAALAFYLLLKSKKFLIILKTIFWTSVFFSLMMPVVSSLILKQLPKVEEDVGVRLILSEQAGRVVAGNFLFGTGLNGFIQKAAGKGVYTDVSWRLQPVHNIFLLTIAEAGIVGLLFFIGILWKAITKVALYKNYITGLGILFILLTGLLDHYWLTLQQNQLLFGLVLGLSFRKDS
jgi:O-antigen ligase